MSENPIDRLRNALPDYIVGYKIETNRVKQAEIVLPIDDKYKSVRIGKFVAIIWNGNGYQWITFDNMPELTWNLSDTKTQREQVIDDELSNLLETEGDYFKVNNPNNAKCKTCDEEYHIQLPMGDKPVTTTLWDNAVCSKGHKGAKFIRFG